MGAYNTVRVDQVCPSCNNLVDVHIQFKYGDTWQYTYQIGDSLKWGGNSIGKPGAKQVVADGVAEGQCPICKYAWPDYEIWIENDKIVDVRTASRKFDFVRLHESYVVLQP